MRFVGDIVAVVVAETRSQAVDAAEAVIVDYDPLPAVIDLDDALAPDAPLLFEELGSNACGGNRGNAGDPLDGRRGDRARPVREPARRGGPDGRRRVSRSSPATTASATTSSCTSPARCRT